jgi:hypothetical protein
MSGIVETSERVLRMLQVSSCFARDREDGRPLVCASLPCACAQSLAGSIDANRYWEGRWRDADAEIKRLRNALQAILSDPEAGILITAYAKTALRTPPQPEAER